MRCGSRSPSLASPLLSSGEGEAGEARPRWTAQWLGRPTKEEGGPRATDRLVPPFAPPPMPSLPEPAPLSLSFLPFGPFQVLAFHSRVPPISDCVRPSGGLSLLVPPSRPCLPSPSYQQPSARPLPPLLPLSSKSQIKGKEGKAEDARRKESQMEHGPHLSLRWAARGSERAGMAESRKEGPSETGRKRSRKEEGGRRPTDRPTACGPGEARLLLLSSSHVLRAATARRARERERGTIITLYKKCVFARSVGRRPPLHHRPLTSFVGDA